MKKRVLLLFLCVRPWTFVGLVLAFAWFTFGVTLTVQAEEDAPTPSALAAATPPIAAVPLANSPERSVDLTAKLSSRLKRDLQASGFKSSDLGIWVGARDEAVQTKANQVARLKTYFGQNAEKSYIPASTSKLVTLGAVLHELQPGYKFKTILGTTAKLENGVLKGDLLLKGGGDPSFVSENMWFLVNELSRAGVTAVEGDLIVDDSRYDQVRWGDDRQEERVDRAYDAPIGALSMNWNSVAVFVRPGDKVGDKLKIFADVASPYIKVKNETKTAPAGHGKTVSVERTSEKDFAGDVIIVHGSLAQDINEVVFYKDITRPDIWTGSNLIEFMKQRGMSVSGKVRAALVPKDFKILATSESKPLSNVVAEMAKWSNNYVAEMLVKALAAEKSAAQGTTAQGIQLVQTYLGKAGLKPGEYSFINAAGFTRKNKLTPEQLGRVLEYVRSDFTIFPEYMAALPIAGIDGTLRNRMKDSEATSWVRAKTGLLNGVVALAGYAGRENGQIVAFAFFYNGGGREDKARALFDQMAAHLVEE